MSTRPEVHVGTPQPKPRGTLQNRPMRDTSKPANRTRQDESSYNRFGKRKQEKSSVFGRTALHCENLSGGYGNAGMRPERRLRGRKGRDGWRSEIPSRLVWQAFLARKR